VTAGDFDSNLIPGSDILVGFTSLLIGSTPKTRRTQNNKQDTDWVGKRVKIFLQEAGCQCLMPAILATSEAEIVRTIIPGQLGQKGLLDPISMEKIWVWWCVPVNLAMVGS
jgi:hypothetical protein